jgi:hypothetical protein
LLSCWIGAMLVHMNNYMQENEAFGVLIKRAVGEFFAIDPTEPSFAERANRQAYKATDCGAWLHFDAYGVFVGTIIEGSDASITERIVVDDLTELDDDRVVSTIIARLSDALQRLEDFADEASQFTGEE